VRAGALAAVCALGTLGGLAVANAQDSAATEAVKARQASFKKVGAASKAIHQELRTSSADAAKLHTAAVEIEHAASVLESWFPRGSGPEAGIKTNARATIWTDAAGFSAARVAFAREADNFLKVLDGKSDTAALNDAAAALAKSCRNCHEDYRRD